MYRILIWGTGRLAQQFIENGYCGEIVGFIETNKSKDIFMDKPVYDSYSIPNEYDYIIVANTHVAEIYVLCLKLCINTDKVIFLRHIKSEIGCVNRAKLKEILMEKNYTNYCAELGILEDTFFYKDMEKYEKLNKRTSFRIEKRYIYPIVGDKYASAGTMGGVFLARFMGCPLNY